MLSLIRNFPYILLFTFCMANSAVVAQKESLFKKNVSLSKHKQLQGNLLLRDRFGNLFHPNELRLKETPSAASGGSTGGSSTAMSMPFPIKDSCTSGMFKLYFVEEPVSGTGFSVSAHRAVICEVFKDLSRLIENQSGSSSAYINIMVASDTSITTKNSGISLPSGVQIVGTSFEPIKYNLAHAWMDNIIYTSIKNGTSAYVNLLGIDNMIHRSFNNYAHGLLIVNFKNKTWYTDFQDTASIPSNQDDLYTHTLKQAMHMLGLYSNILENGTARGGNNLYARYDSYLYKNNTSSKLFTYASSTKKITQTTALPAGCANPDDIRFIGDSANIHVYNDTPWKANINLGNFSCAGNVCNASYAKPNNHFVLVPCLGSGHTYLKRHPSQDEVYALCDLGYKLKNVGGVYAYGASASNNDSLGNVYKTYSACTEPCIAIGGHDTILMDTLKSCTRSFSTKILPNDMPASALIMRMELLDTTLGTLSYNTSSFTFTPKPHFKYGEVRIVYFPQCASSAQLGNATYITIRYPYPPLPACAPNDDCNYICYGTFEESDDPYLWHGFLVYEPDVDYNTADLWHSTGAVTCRRNVIDNYWADCNVVDSGCNFKSYGVHPHIEGGHQFMGIYAESGADVYSEGFHFKLKKPIYHDTTKRMKLRFLAKVFNGCANNFKMLVVANDSLPQPPPSTLRSKNGGLGVSCLQYCDTIASTVLSADTWAYYTLPIAMPQPGDSFTDIIVLSDVALNPMEPTILQHYCYFDNFELYDSLATRAVISSNPHSLIPCNDTTQTIEYYICLENSSGANTDSIRVQINLPYGFSVAAGSDFDAQGRYTLPVGAISNTVCDTLILKYTIDYTKVATDRGHTITAGYTCNAYCASDVSDWVRVYPKNYAVSVSKTVNNPNPMVGDTVIFTYNVCNVSPLNLSDLVFTDTFPAELKPLLYQTGPSLNGQILSYALSIDSAFSSSNPRCIQFTCHARVMSSCKITTIASLKSIANPCFYAQTVRSLNDTVSGSPVRATIKPTSAVWCGNTIPLQVVIDNPSGSYTYQWFFNGSNVGTNSASHSATSQGLYTVNVAQNGCITKVESKLFDTAFNVTYTTAPTICTAQNGAIYLQAINGLKPYTYTWSGSGVTDSFRIGLTDSSYMVTVTDSIGCARTFTIPISKRTDTLLLAKTIVHPQCTASNGSISILPSGGTAPYSYLWTGGITTQNRWGLNAGSYVLTITDTNGCALIDSSTLSVLPSSIVLSDSVVSSNCATPTGSIYINTSGGTNPYTYSWSNAVTTKNNINISPASYTLTVSDSFGCTATKSITLTAYADTNFKLTDSIRSSYCGSFSGAIYVYSLTGTAPYSYAWSSGHNTQNLIGVDTGQYTLTVTDANGCIAIDSFYIPRQEGNLSLSFYHSYDCWNMLAHTLIEPYQGQEPYFILWSDADTARNRSNMSAGMYSVQVWDSLGCTASYSFEHDFLNTIQTDKYQTQPKCGKKGSIRIVPISGVAPFEYYWEDIAAMGDSVRTQLEPGTYIVWTSDAMGCSQSDTIVMLPDATPSSLDAYVKINANCAAGVTSILKAVVLTAQLPVSYLWSTGATTDSIAVTNLSSPYTVTITEPNGCKKIVTQTPHPDSFLLLGDGYGGSGYADLQSAIAANRLPAAKLSKLNIKVKGTFTLNSNADIRYCNIVFDAGAKIDVPTGCNGNTMDSLTLLHNQFYTCGSTLAHGIHIRECLYSGNMFGFRLTMQNNSIRDCYKALDIQRSLIPHMVNNVFEDNLIGIHLWGDDIQVCTPFPQTIYLPEYLTIYGNTFRGSGTTQATGKVKMPYINMPLNQYVKFRPAISSTTSYGVPLAGIIAENTRTLTLGNGNYASNIFENLNNGLLAYGSDIYIYNTLFKDMLYKASTPMPEYAIYSEGNRFSQGGSLIFGGYSSNAAPHISNVLNGVYTTEHQNTNVTGVYFSGVTNAVVTEVNHGYMLNKTLTVKNCKFEGGAKPAHVGVDIVDNSLDRFIAVIENNNFKDVVNYSVRALKNTKSFTQSALNIENNIIKGAAHRGIHLLNYPIGSNSQKVKVAGNNIQLTTNAMRNGIHYYDCKDIIDKENTVKGFSPTWEYNLFGNRGPVGIFYEVSDGSFTCDVIDSVAHGVRFMGNCDASTWAKNKINNHIIGLKIDTLTTIQNQYWKGNTFSGSCFREAQSNQRIPTAFYYSNLASEYLPSPRFPIGTRDWWQFLLDTTKKIVPYIPENSNCFNILNPNNWVSVPIGNKGDIIVKDIGGSFSPIGNTNEPVFGIYMTNTDTAILMNNMVFGSFEVELTWQYRQELYNKIKPFENDLKDTSVFRDYLTQMEMGSINEFTQINVMDREAYEAAQAYFTQIYNLKTSIDSAWNKLRELDSTYNFAIDSSSLSDIKQLRTLLRKWIWSRDTALQNLLFIADTTYQSEINQIQYVSDSIVPECISDSLRNVFLSLYYQTYGVGQTQLTVPQIQTFTSLALHCPFENFEAVHRSRGILWSRGDTTTYYDSLLCAPLGITLKALRPIHYYPIQTKKELKFSLFPNPTADYAHVSLSFIPDMEFTFVLSDVLGRKLYSETRMMNTNRHTLNMRAWENGLYFLSIYHGTSNIFNSHIQILK